MELPRPLLPPRELEPPRLEDLRPLEPERAEDFRPPEAFRPALFDALFLAELLFFAPDFEPEAFRPLPDEALAPDDFRLLPPARVPLFAPLFRPELLPELDPLSRDEPADPLDADPAPALRVIDPELPAPDARPKAPELAPLLAPEPDRPEAELPDDPAPALEPEPPEL